MNSFRKLKAEEIACKKQKVNAGGVECLLWAKKFAVPDVLDETVGPERWSAGYVSDSIVSLSIIKDDGTLFTRLGTCDSESVGKAALTEAITLAGVYFGIGRELYTAPEIFFHRDDLKNYSYENGKGVCYDMFTVEKITYAGDNIADVTISVINCKDHKKYFTKTFTAKPVDNSVKPVVGTESIPGSERTIKLSVASEKNEAAVTKPEISDDEIILIGKCKGKTYGEAKGSQVFLSFLEWAKTSTTQYDDPKKAEQLIKFKNLAKTAA